MNLAETLRLQSELSRKEIDAKDAANLADRLRKHAQEASVHGRHEIRCEDSDFDRIVVRKIVQTLLEEDGFKVTVKGRSAFRSRSFIELKW